jgi:hypothetical protein
MLSRFLYNPGEEHWKMTDYLMQYLAAEPETEG